jgi:hypothetical protein
MEGVGIGDHRRAGGACVSGSRTGQGQGRRVPASSLPYFIAIERGFFKEQNIEPEEIRLIGGPSNIKAMISNQIEAAAGS